MGQRRDSLEHQLKHARESLSTWVKVLNEQGIAGGQRRRDPKWRGLNARCNHIEARLRKVAEIIAVDEELKRRKAEKRAAVSDEKKPKKRKTKASKDKQRTVKADAAKPKAKQHKNGTKQSKQKKKKQ